MTKRYFDKIYRENLPKEESHPFLPRHLTILSLIRGDKRKVRILDLGCGAGDVLRLLQKNGWQKIKGIDFSREAANYLKNKGFKVKIFDLEKDKPDIKIKFDYLICADVLEHLKKPEAVFKNFKDTLNDNGVFIVTVPNAGWYLDRVLKKFFPSLLRISPAYGPWEHIHFFTLASLKNLGAKWGFIVNRMRGVPYYRPKPQKRNLFRSILVGLCLLPVKFTNLFVNIYPSLFSSHLVVEFRLKK